MQRNRKLRKLPTEHTEHTKNTEKEIRLSQRNLYAGTPSIVASLWNVDPDYTEKLMVSFYRALKNTDKIEALHQARKEMMEKMAKNTPFTGRPLY